MKNFGLIIFASLLVTTAHAQMEREESISTAPTVNAEGEIIRKNNWRASYFSIMSTETKAFDYGNPSVGGYHYLGVSYKVSRDTRVSVKVPFIFEFAGKNNRGFDDPQQLFLSDIHVTYSDYDLFNFWEVEVAAAFKLYFPTSENSQATKMMAKFRPEMYWEWEYARYSSLTWVVKPDYYFQRQTAYVRSDAKYNNDGSFVFDPRRTNRIASLEHYLEWDLNINKYFSFLPSAGFAEDWYYGSEAEGLEGGHDTKSRMAIGFQVRPMRGLDFSLWLQNNASLTGAQPVRLWHPDDNQLVLMTNASLFTW